MVEHGLELDKEGKDSSSIKVADWSLRSVPTLLPTTRHLQEAHGIVPVSEERRQRIQENNTIKESTLEDVSRKIEMDND
jgi:hypothetical protein